MEHAIDHDIITGVGERMLILDLGCGDGAEALELARRGCEVTCVDRSEQLIERIRKTVAREGIAINAIRADLNDYAPQGSCDAIIMSGVLHFLERDRAFALIDACKNHTARGGVHIIGALLEGDETDADGYYFSTNELRTFYADWTINEYEEPDPDGGTNRIAWIVAERAER